MKKIRYKLPAAMLEHGSDGKLIRKPLTATTETPFSEENLLQAEAKALPGTVQIVESQEQAVPSVVAQDCICLIDRATGKPFEVYIENGQLMMEVM